ncbi:hypothetical protein ACEWY4_015839 [Coilia grayii]|uniref:CD44 antigen n=1 Tax=Coilia grayii TaxID=363190 RepID=A0ABD1JP58_9TELE
MWDLLQFLTSGLLAVVGTGTPQVEHRSCSYGGVFHVRVSSNYSLTFQEADELCQSLYGNLATETQIREAFSKGLDTCRYGWIHDQHILMVHHGVQPDCPSNGTGIHFLEDTPESLTDAYCYDPSVTSDITCDESVVSESVTPPDTKTTKESTAVTSGPSESVIEKVPTEVSLEEDGLETKNPTVQTHTEISPDTVESIPEVQHPTDGPEDANGSTTEPSEMAPTGRDELAEGIEVATKPTTGDPMTTTGEREKEPGEGMIATHSEDDEALGSDATTTSPDETTPHGDHEHTAAEDGDVKQVNGTEAIAEDTDVQQSNGTQTVLEEADVQQVDGTETEDVPTTTVPGTLKPSEASPSEGDEEEDEELLGLPTSIPVYTTTATFTATESEDADQEGNAESREESTTEASLDSMPETTETPGDKDVDLKEEPSNDYDQKHAISSGSPGGPRGRMGPKNTQKEAKPTPASQEASGAPGWLIIFSFVMVVGALLCIFAAIATKERWLGPRRRSQTQVKDSSGNGEKKAALSLTAEKQHEMVTLMNNGQVQTNGRMDEFTVIALEEPPEKEFLA